MKRYYSIYALQASPNEWLYAIIGDSKLSRLISVRIVINTGRLRVYKSPTSVKRSKQ